SSSVHRQHTTSLSFFLLLPRPPRTSPLFPYTTLFRSPRAVRDVREAGAAHQVRRAGLPGGRGTRRRCGGADDRLPGGREDQRGGDRKSTRLNSSHVAISYAVFCLKKKTDTATTATLQQ